MHRNLTIGHSNANNTGQTNMNSKHDESFLIRSIVVGHGNQNLLMALGDMGQALGQIPDTPKGDKKLPQKNSTPGGSIGTTSTSTPGPSLFWKGRLENNNPTITPDRARDTGIKGDSVKPNATTPSINAMLANPKPNPTPPIDSQDPTKPQFYVITPEGVINHNKIQIIYRTKPIEGVPPVLMNPDLWKNENEGTVIDQWAALSPEERAAIEQIGFDDGYMVGLETLEWLHVSESQKVALEVPSARSMTILVQKAALSRQNSGSRRRHKPPPTEKHSSFSLECGLDSALYQEVMDEPVLPSRRPVPEWLERTTSSSGTSLNPLEPLITAGAKLPNRRAEERRASGAPRRDSSPELPPRSTYMETHIENSSRAPVVHHSNVETRMVSEGGSPYDALQPSFTQSPYEKSGPSQPKRFKPSHFFHSTPSELSVSEDKLGWEDSSASGITFLESKGKSEREEESEFESESGPEDEGGDTERAEELVQNLLNRFTTL